MLRWLIFAAFAGIFVWARHARRMRRALAAPDTPALLGPVDIADPDPDGLIRLALTHQGRLEGARVRAVEALAAQGHLSARPALKALAEPTATFSTPRLRQAARRALAEMNREHGEQQGSLSLAEPEGERGALSTTGAPGALSTTEPPS